MGLCGSKEQLTAEEDRARQEAKKRSQALERELANQNARENAIHKLLLLGAGESGKSTLFKQMIKIYGKGFPENERKQYIPIVHNNVITSMKTMCEQTDRLGAQQPECLVAPNNNGLKNKILELKQSDNIDPALARDLKVLWQDPGIKNTYANRAKYQLTDSTDYFLDRLDDIGRPDYIPSEQDVLRSRVRTTGIVENAFEIEGNTFKLFDVGGQRNERKKWIHCFSEVTAVLFVAALSEYDQVLFEDETTNRMDEATNLFDEICNSQWFRKTAVILLLNKRDLFAKKIAKIPLTVWHPNYDGLSNYDEGVEYIQEVFLRKKKDAKKQVYVHITCATDTETMKVVFNAVKDIVIRKSLQEGGLLV